jgi:hypothetical protein
MYDKNHPYQTGFDKMANVWMREIDKICENTPQLINPGAQTSDEGEVPNLLIETNGADDYTISFDENGLPPGLWIKKIDSTTARIKGTIQEGAHSSSPYNVRVSISDELGELDQVKFSWTVLETKEIFIPLAINK